MSEDRKLRPSSNTTMPTASNAGSKVPSSTPFPNCSFRVCYMRALCQSNGKCNHPREPEKVMIELVKRLRAQEAVGAAMEAAKERTECLIWHTAR